MMRRLWGAEGSCAEAGVGSAIVRQMVRQWRMMDFIGKVFGKE
jgi:hypothetical protein